MTTKFLLSSDDNTRSGLLKKKIIHYYMANGDATIAEVCKEMNLSIPTVTKLISELQEDGYILDFGKQETSGGRKPSIYGLNPVSGYFVGVDILKDQLNLAILDFKGDKIRIEQNIPYTLENTPAALDHLCECINEFINSLPIPREKILSIGINISGRVNPFAGYSYSIFYFEEKPLSQILEEKLHIKIYIENDTRSMAYGEYLQGVVKGEKNILFINISWGLGIGIIIDGKVYFGKSGFSGEFGHNFPMIIGGGLCFGIGYGIFDANNMPILCQFISPRYRATAYGIMNMTGVFAGAAITDILGKSTDAGNLGHDFAMLAGLVLIALLIQVIFLRPKVANMTDEC